MSTCHSPPAISDDYGMATKPEVPITAYPGPAIESESQIRVLELQPGQPSDGIECHLRTLNLDKKEDLDDAYDALSYTWGAWVDHDWINLDGQKFPVTQNLWSALRRLRKTYAVRRLWIDQLCVNQKGTFERNHQVRLMGRVYRRASRVVVWLGDVDDIAIEHCRKDSLPSDALVGLQKQGLVFLEDPGIKHKRLVLQAAIQHTQPKWWERVWVVQEVAKATTEPVFTFGCFEVSFEELQRLQRQSDQTISELVKSFRATGQSLVSMRRTIARTASSDKRDKVYALLDLILPAEKKLIEIDYNRSVAIVFAEATFASIKTNADFGLLSFVSHDKDHLPGLPSWCFDFTSSHHSTNLRPRIHKGAIPKPWTRRKRHIDASLTFDLEDNSLSFKGLRFDSIITTFNADIYWVNGVAGLPQAARDRTLYPINWELTSELPYAMASHIKSDSNAHSKAIKRIEATRSDRRGVASMPVPDICDIWFACVQPRTKCGPFQREFCHEWLQYLEAVSPEKPTFFVTESGFIGMGKAGVREGDQIVLPFGGDAPVVLRQKDGDMSWSFHGFAYVNGIMNGELITAAPNLEPEESEFKLV